MKRLLTIALLALLALLTGCTSVAPPALHVSRTVIVVTQGEPMRMYEVCGSITVRHGEVVMKGVQQIPGICHEGSNNINLYVSRADYVTVDGQEVYESKANLLRYGASE